MENSSHNYVRIENAKFGNRGIIYTASVFAISFLICAIIGATGPEVIQIRDAGTTLLPVGSNDIAVWDGVLEDMTPLNQMFWLSARIYRVYDYPDEEVGELETWLNVTGLEPFVDTYPQVSHIAEDRYKKQTIRCKANKAECKSFYIFGQPSVGYRKYSVRIHLKDTQSQFTESNKITIKVDLHTINSEYSKFELGWKCFFILTTLVVMFLPQEGFVIKLISIPYRLWSFEQSWVLTLLVGLIFFNDPFFAAQLYTSSADSMAILYIFFTSTFISTVLIFWLCVLDEMRSTDSGGVASGDTGRRRPFLFYTPKLVLVALIWTMLMTTYAYVRMERLGDPTYEGINDWVLLDIEIVLAILLFLYCIYLFALLVLSASRIVALSPPFKFLFFVTLFCYIAVMSGLFLGYFYPLATSAIVFLSFYAILNFYVWTLAFAYAPLGNEDGYSKGPTTFGEDYFDECGGLAGGHDVMGDSMFDM